MTAIILAGGKATRMGRRDKAFLKIGDETLIHRQLRLLRKIFKHIIIVTNSLEKYKKLRKVKLVSDIIANRGPLAGIYSGLMASGDSYNFVVACDMPFINPHLIKYMCNNIGNYDIAVPKINGKFHPLFAIYSQNCIPVLEKMLNLDRLKVSSIFSKLKVRFISKRQLQKFDKPLLSLENINTRGGLIKAQRLEV